MRETKTVYFDGPGQDNTDTTFALARERAAELGIRDIVIASTAGETGAKAARFFSGFRVVVVSHSTGFRRANQQEMTPELRAEIESAGATVLTSLQPFGGIGRAIRMRFATFTVEEVISNVLKLFGQGMKVVVEVTMMAADAGLVQTGQEVLAVAGTDHGADTAAVISAANTLRIFDLRVREIICKPR